MGGPKNFSFKRLPEKRKKEKKKKWPEFCQRHYAGFFFLTMEKGKKRERSVCPGYYYAE